METEVFCQLAVHSLLQKPLDEVLVDLLAAKLVEDVKAGDDLETVLSANAPRESGEKELGHSVVTRLLKMDFCCNVGQDVEAHLVQVCPAGVDTEEDEAKTGEVLGQHRAVVLLETEIPDHGGHLQDPLTGELLGAVSSPGSK